jgi:enoyl-CoA hydratase
MLEFEERGHVAILTLNRPEARNAIDPATTKALEAALDRIEEDPNLWVSILAAKGPVFCAGADLKVIAADGGRGINTRRGGFAGFVARERTKPMIVAVDGPALAGGTEISVACEMIVASTRATFGIPEVKRSLLAGGGALFRLPKVLPRNLAYELALTGDPISAERAYSYGMVNVLCEPGEALSEAIKLAERIAANAPVAVRESLRTMKETAVAEESEAFKESRAAMMRVSETEDFREGPRAFLEKRAPEWKGR